MQLPLTYYSLGVTISFCKFWFEDDTLIHIRFNNMIIRNVSCEIRNVSFAYQNEKH